MRTLRLLAYYVLGMMLAALSCVAFAEGTVPSTNAEVPYTLGSGPAPIYWNTSSTATSPQLDRNAAGVYACQNHVNPPTSLRYMVYSGEMSTDQAKCGTTTTVATINIYAHVVCDGGLLTGTFPNQTCSAVKTCPAGYSLNAGATACTNGGTPCPTNSTGPVSGQCTCNVGYDPNNGQCVARTCPSAGSAAGSVAFPESSPNRRYLGWADTSRTSTSRAFGTSTVGCSSGCRVESQATVCVPYGGQAGLLNCGMADPSYTGAACTGTEIATGSMSTTAGDTKRTTELDCGSKGLGSATINGITTCAEPSAAAPVTTTDRKTETTAAGQTVTDKTVTDNGSKVTTSTTSTPPGGSPTTTTTDQSKNQFCEEHPNSELCKPGKDPCEENPQRLGCAEFGDVPDSNLGTQSIGPSSIAPVSVGASMSCPANVALPHGMQFEWTPICTFAGGLRPVVLALAWLAAGLIVFGAIRES